MEKVLIVTKLDLDLNKNPEERSSSTHITYIFSNIKQDAVEPKDMI